MDKAVAAAVKHGAVRVITTFPDPIGRDVVVQWPAASTCSSIGTPPSRVYAPLANVPENRVYLTADAAGAFLKSWGGYAHARVLSDDKAADGVDIGQPGKTYRRCA